MIFSHGFVATPSPNSAFCPVGLVQCAVQAVSVAMPILKDGNAPR